MGSLSFELVNIWLLFLYLVEAVRSGMQVDIIVCFLDYTNFTSYLLANGGYYVVAILAN